VKLRDVSLLETPTSRLSMCSSSLSTSFPLWCLYHIRCAVFAVIGFCLVQPGSLQRSMNGWKVFTHLPRESQKGLAKAPTSMAQSLQHPSFFATASATSNNPVTTRMTINADQTCGIGINQGVEGATGQLPS
jgi:hypothetical protein